MPRTIQIILTGFIVLLTTDSAIAHHGWSRYTKADFTLMGVVVEKDFGNPHDRLSVEIDGQVWNALMSPPGRSRSAGFSEKEISIGDTVTLHGHRHSDKKVFEMKTERIEVNGKSYGLYPERY